jgi:hypothetical protein
MGCWRWLRLVPLLAFGIACGDARYTPIPGTTMRIEQPIPDSDKEYELQIFASEEECDEARIHPDDWHLCLPHVDRASGEVRLGYRFIAGEMHVGLAEHEELMEVQFQGTTVSDGKNGQEIKIIPHEPFSGGGTLYVLLIDGSGSMSEIDRRSGDSRMKQVKKALRQPEVISAFFPGGDTDNAVMLLQFTQGSPVPVGGSLTALTNKNEYKQAVRELKVLNGFTHLFKAIKYSTGPLLDEDAVKAAVAGDKRSVTVVALTDGFNNLAASDTCKDNVPRLKLLLEHLATVRESDVRSRPTLHTVGLGKPIRPGFEPPRGMEPPRATTICGRRNVDTRIDGDLETRGIDNASLRLIARAGGGTAHIKRGRKGLAEAFLAAAAPKYRWFEVRYRMDPFFLRRAFKTRLSLVGVGTAGATIQIHPSAWLDAPPGRLMEDGWHMEENYLVTFLVVMPLFAAFVGLSYVGAAVHNTRRMLFGRVRRNVPTEPAAEDGAPGAAG